MHISTLIDSISQLRDINLLLLVRNQTVADKFLKAKSLLDICPTSVKLRDSLNYVKGIIYALCLNGVSEEEIVKELRHQGVVAMYKFMKKVDNSMEGNDYFVDDLNPNATKQVYSGYMVLTFNLYFWQKIIHVAWYKVKIKLYFPNPMRCKN